MEATRVTPLRKLALHALRDQFLSHPPQTVASLPTDDAEWLLLEIADRLVQDAGHLWPPIELLRLWYGDHLNRLTLHGLFDEAAVEIFGGGIQRLTRLVLRDARITQVGAGHLACSCSFSHSLLDLRVHGCTSLGAGGIAQLCCIASLRRLRLIDCALALDVEGARPLLRLPDLTELDLTGNALDAAAAALLCSEQNIASVPSARRLCALRLSGSLADDDAAMASMGLGSLTALDLSLSRVSGDGAQMIALGLSSRLKELRLGGCTLIEPGSSAAFLPLLRRVRKLSLSGLELSAADLRAACDLPALRALDVREVRVHGGAAALAAFEAVSHARRLRELRLDGLRPARDMDSTSLPPPTTLTTMLGPQGQGVRLDFGELDGAALAQEQRRRVTQRGRKGRRAGVTELETSHEPALTSWEEEAGAWGEAEEEEDVDEDEEEEEDKEDEEEGSAGGSGQAPADPPTSTGTYASPGASTGAPIGAVTSTGTYASPGAPIGAVWPAGWSADPWAMPALQRLSANGCRFLQDERLFACSALAQTAMLRSTASLQALQLRGLGALVRVVVGARPMGLPLLRELDASETGSGDEFLEWVALCPRLRELDVSGNPNLTDAGVDALRPLHRSLHTLRMNRVPLLTAHALTPLRALTALRVIELDGCAISGQQQGTLPSRQLAAEAAKQASDAFTRFQALIATRERAAAKAAAPIQYDEATLLKLRASPFSRLPTRLLPGLPGIVVDAGRQ